MTADAHSDKVTELTQPRWIPPLFMLLGAGAGWLLKLLAQWVVTLPWAPFQGPAELLTEAPEPWLTLAAIGVGTAAGLLFGLYALHVELSLRVSADRVVLGRGGTTREVGADEIALVCRDGKDLVLLGHEGEELAREDSDLADRRFREAFTRHGHAWADQDPHRDAYRRWVPGTPGLPAGADALLKARARVLDKGDAATEARELRAELVRLGVFVRDEKKRQFWRTSAHQAS
ncbi:YqeB family protein [Streptomyces sp. NBC_01304]|uniref:YqeB family protein n=1 Tax=Streptomyces sp. NBC_01304 TaxID=2903818 RepID=UPI002E0FE710|nr:hypothetical protein OG430_13305 [Streptomyces sp. NBC_01304]